ncbi:MAG: aspartate kinase [Ichthyobacteriaceae bacterium]|nr:aspartate kinase [Ichthyobacteriaceae bacterium]
MKTVAQSVEKIIKQKPFLESALAQGIINMTSLAKQIQPAVQTDLRKDVQSGAIVMAVKRLAPTLEFQINRKVKDVLNNLGDITVRSKLSDYTFSSSNTLVKNQAKLLDLVSKHSDLYYALSKGVYETTIIVSDKLNEEIELIFADEVLVTKQTGLSALTIKLPVENTKVSGIYYYVFRDLAWDGINVIEVVSTTNEFTIVVEDFQVEKAFCLLKNLGKN